MDPDLNDTELAIMRALRAGGGTVTANELAGWTDWDDYSTDLRVAVSALQGRGVVAVDPGQVVRLA